MKPTHVNKNGGLTAETIHNKMEELFMKRMIVFALVCIMVTSMAVTSYAVTPSYKPPKLPEIKVDTSNIQVEVSQSFWDKWFAEHPIQIK